MTLGLPPLGLRSERVGASTTDEVVNAGRDLSQIIEITDDGVYTWWHESRAVGPNWPNVTVNKTFSGHINQAGDAVASSYDHSSEAVTTTTLHANFQDDDHDNPSILVTSDGKLWYLYSKHGDESQFYYRISSSAGDISTFDAEQTVTTPTGDVTYPSGVEFDNGDIRVYHREGGDYTYVDLPDGGSWSSPTKLWDGAVYTKVRPIGNDVGLGLTTNAGGPGVGDTGIAYVEYDRSADAYLDAAGNDLGALPIDDTALNQIWDASATGERAWMWDINFDSNNNPVLLFATFPSIHHHVYRHAEWKDGSWDVTKVCDAGTYIANSNQDYYSAGACLDDNDPSVVYAGVGGPRGSAIQRWEKTDSTWSYQPIVGAQTHNCRPVSPRGAHDDLRLMWLRGPYRHWQYGSYETGVVGSDGSQTVSVDMPTTPVLYDRACRLSTSSESLDTEGGSDNWNNINWSTEHDDRGGFWDSGQANNYDVFIPTWGRYLVTVRVELEALSAAATVDLQLFDGVKTLASNIHLAREEASAGESPKLSGTVPILANADRPMSGGRVIARVQHDSGNTESLSNAEIEVTQVSP